MCTSLAYSIISNFPLHCERTEQHNIVASEQKDAQSPGYSLAKVNYAPPNYDLVISHFQCCEMSELWLSRWFLSEESDKMSRWNRPHDICDVYNSAENEFSSEIASFATGLWDILLLGGHDTLTAFAQYQCLHLLPSPRWIDFMRPLLQHRMWRFFLRIRERFYSQIKGWVFVN